MKYLSALFLVIISTLISTNAQVNWITTFESELPKIERKTGGEIGVYIKNLNDNQMLNYNTDVYWYLSSTVKIPLAIAILQKVEAGELSLNDRITLKQTDFVDGSGDLLWAEPGTSYTIATLIDKMMRNSDSSATDMLFRLLGEDEFNRQIQEQIVSEGINRITTIMQVRYDAYSEIHESVKNLSNMDIIKINSGSTLTDRWNTLTQQLDVDKSQLKASSIEEAFERYYTRNINSGKLQSMGRMLEKLHRGELLNAEHTKLLIGIMERITTGDKRIKAGLPPKTRFAHKTGTQIRQACDIGMIYPGKNEEPIILAVCIKNHDRINNAEQAFEEIGNTVSQIFLKK
jgi:beta-lactamase class A